MIIYCAYRTSDKLEKNLRPERCDLCCCPLDLEEDEALLTDENRIQLVQQLYRTNPQRYSSLSINYLGIFLCIFSGNPVHVCYACRRVLRDVQVKVT